MLPTLECQGTEKVEIRLIRRHCKERRYFAVYSIMVRLHHFVYGRTGCNVMFKHHSNPASMRQNWKEYAGERKKICSLQTVGFPRSVRRIFPATLFPTTWEWTLFRGEEWYGVCLPLFLTRGITFWTGTMASIRAPVDVHRKTHINSDRLDEAVWFAVGSMWWFRYAGTKRKGFISRHIETVPSLRSDTSCCPPGKTPCNVC